MRQEFFNLELSTNGQSLYEFISETNKWIKDNEFNNGIYHAVGHSGRCGADPRTRARHHRTPVGDAGHPGRDHGRQDRRQWPGDRGGVAAVAAGDGAGGSGGAGAGLAAALCRWCGALSAVGDGAGHPSGDDRPLDAAIRPAGDPGDRDHEPALGIVHPA